MNEEIIDRLKVATVDNTADSLYQLMDDAICEIERLRTELKMVRGE